MDTFTIGQTVRILGPTLPGSVGTIVHLDTKREKYLVRVDATVQAYFSEDQLELFQP